MKNQVYAVIDTNVLVSALIAKDPNYSYPLKVLECAFNGKIVPIFNDEILDEYKSVLHRAKFNLSEMDIKDAISVLHRIGVNTERTPITDKSFPDESDRKFYEVMVGWDNAFLITGNGKHFPKAPRVVTPRAMVEILEGEK